MGEEYKRKLMKEYGVNPDATSRDWKDPEHEIIALFLEKEMTEIKNKVDTGFSSIRQRLGNNEEMLDNHDNILQAHDEWIEKRRGNLADEDREEKLNIERGKRNWTMYGVWAMVIVNVVSWLLIYLGIIG